MHALVEKSSLCQPLSLVFAGKILRNDAVRTERVVRFLLVIAREGSSSAGRRASHSLVRELDLDSLVIGLSAANKTTAWPHAHQGWSEGGVRMDGPVYAQHMHVSALCRSAGI